MEDLQLTFWHWWILGLGLLILEMLLPGTFFLWMGIASFVVGLLLMLIADLSWQLQLTLFAILSVVSTLSWRGWQKRNPDETDQPRLNRRGEQYIDRVFTLEEDIINGVGKIRVDDSSWRIEGPDCEAGTRVRVVDVDGVVLVIECLADPGST